MKKKIISLCLVIALVATAIAGATLAYFTDVTDVNTNTFTVGDVDIKLDETDTDDSTPDADRDTENEYENIYPNQTVVKDPMVTFVKDSRDCYVRMLVTVDYDKLVKAFPKDDTDYDGFWRGDLFMLEKLVVDADGTCTWDKAKWPVADVTYETEKVTDENGEEKEIVKYATYEFRFHEKLVAPKDGVTLDPLFKNITFPANMTNEQIAALNGFKVDVVAHAIQAEGFDTAENPMAAAWAAWTATGDANLTTEAAEETTVAPSEGNEFND